MKNTPPRFQFGKNWQTYSRNALSEKNIARARQAFSTLYKNIDLAHKRFIDIGFGQGLSLIIAAEMNAQVLGIDNDADTLAALETTKNMMGYTGAIETLTESILNETFINTYRAYFDIVHSWGALHHTGNMAGAIKNACALVKHNGYFVCALYNHHWSSPLWGILKRTYATMPQVLQQLTVALLCPIIYIAKLIITRKNPLIKERGMDFYYDIIDWIGGYPYEYGSIDEIKKEIMQHGFICLSARKPQIPTGCNEFIFRKIAQ